MRNSVDSPGMYADLKNKNVLVTGGAAGLGYAIAGAFASQEARVLIVGRNKERLERASAALGGNVRSKVFDMNDIEVIPSFVRETTADGGAIDVLVNNAGIH